MPIPPLFSFLCLYYIFTALPSCWGIDLNSEQPQIAVSRGLPEDTFLVAGQDGLCALAEYLDANPTTGVSRLFLSDSAPGNESAVNADAFAACPIIKLLTNRILHYTHGMLLGFSYLLYTCDADSFREYEFPELRELTLGVDEVWRYQDIIFQKESLTHLHVASGHHDHTPPSMAVILGALQNLTHLRISGPRKEGDVPAMDWQTPSPAFGLFHQASFNSVVIPPDFILMIQPGPNPDLNDFSSGAYTSFVQHLARHPNVRLRSAPRVKDDGFLGSDLRLVLPLTYAIAQFMNRSRGGLGDWGSLTTGEMYLWAKDFLSA
ncbi:hypothetical protein B0H16DRAFT_1727971 [Mycena metata]|uniref:Uncharacterized protein n=1 Tax=Mycena metata TaxID=1033252 RepID=A0AAD7N2L9_9AGAR|nr:hypothetical protein B0H16DRAFT_1727971 [Mycena metata]